MQNEWVAKMAWVLNERREGLLCYSHAECIADEWAGSTGARSTEKVMGVNLHVLARCAPIAGGRFQFSFVPLALRGSAALALLSRSGAAKWINSFARRFPRPNDGSNCACPIGRRRALKLP